MLVYFLLFIIAAFVITSFFKERFLFLLIVYHQFFIFILFHLLCYFLSFCFYYYIFYNNSLPFCFGYLPRIEAEFRIDEEYVAKMLPFYLDMHKYPSFEAPKTTDLIGLIEIFEAEGPQRVERILFYRFMDYVVQYTACHFVLDSTDVIPDHTNRLLIARTMLEYRDQDWQSYNVRLINQRLVELNKELAILLVERHDTAYSFRKILVEKDFYAMGLKHSVYGELAGLSPVDYIWGRYSPSALAEQRFTYTWDNMRETPLKFELVYEYLVMDCEIIRDYLNRRIEGNVKTYNDLLKLKWAYEKLDLEISGKKLEYIDIVRYRTFSGFEMITDYAGIRAEVIKAASKEYLTIHDKIIKEYKRSFDIDKDFMGELKERMETELEARIETMKKKPFRKSW